MRHAFALLLIRKNTPVEGLYGRAAEYRPVHRKARSVTPTVPRLHRRIPCHLAPEVRARCGDSVEGPGVVAGDRQLLTLDGRDGARPALELRRIERARWDGATNEVHDRTGTLGDDSRGRAHR